MTFRSAARLAPVLASLGLLVGCNMLMTQTPLFTKADEAGAPGLRPGIWAQDSTDKCEFDVNLPLASWPSCANGFVVESDGALGAFNEQDGKQVWSTSPFVLAAGDPRVIQVRMADDATVAPAHPPFAYAGLRPTRLDDRGQIIALTSWVVLCGPAPPSTAKKPDGEMRFGTLHPLHGLAMDADGDDCTTTSQADARLAAKASQAWTKPDSLNSDHWVRDGDH